MLQKSFVQKWLVTVRHILLGFINLLYRKLFGMKIHPTARISLKAKLDKRNPAGIHIGEYSYVAFGAVLLAHDMASNKRSSVIIGKKCFIGANSIILPGVTVNDNSVVAAGSVVSKDVPPNAIVAGNPAVIIKENILTQEYGQMIS